MRLSNLNNTYTHYKYLLCCILLFPSFTQTHALNNDNLDIQIDTPILDSYPTKPKDLYFEDFSLKKKDLNINSDGASITDLNSDTAIFTFSGNVSIISEIVVIKCDKAILEFEENELKNARFIGALSSFKQFDDEKEMIASGAAEVFEYDHISNILRMETNAWVNNGSNEVTGNLITYNLVKRNIIADSENGSPVKLIIDSAKIN